MDPGSPLVATNATGVSCVIASSMTAVPSSTALLSMKGIVKRFPGVIALSGVSLTLHAGEVLALMGENGAGKSTLMKILGGAHPPHERAISLDGTQSLLSG